jgi:hypothetical protein
MCGCKEIRRGGGDNTHVLLAWRVASDFADLLSRRGCLFGLVY